MAKRKARAQNQHDPKGEMRRRWGALWADGSFTRIGAQGLRMALWAFYRGDFKTCEVRVSVRELARQMGVGTSTVHRGINELVSEGILELVRGGGAGRRSVYMVANRAPVGNTTVPEVGTDCSGGRQQPFRRPATTAPPLGTNRSGGGNKPRPHVEPLTNISIGNQCITNGFINADAAGAGRRPAPPLREDRRIRDDDDGEGTPGPAHQAATADS